MAYGLRVSSPMLLRIVSRSFEAAKLARLHELPSSTPKPTMVPCFKKFRRLTPFLIGRIETSVFDQPTHYKSTVIPGELAIASATRNPGNQKTSGYPLSRV